MSNLREGSEERYYRLLENCIASMTGLDDFNMEKLFANLAQLSVLLRVAKGVTTFYDSPAMEAKGHGEEFVCYDSGEPCELATIKRAVTPSGMVVTCAAYQKVGDAPFTPVERERVELIQNMILTIINRRRQEKFLNKMAYTDEDGYRNLRYFARHVIRLSEMGKLPGMTAFRINLKHFSLVNQQIGREAANEVMKAFYKSLMDAVGEDGCVGRLGGDNFVAICGEERLSRTLDCLSGQSISFQDGKFRGPAESVPVQIRVVISGLAGAFTVPKSFTTCKFNDVMDRIMAAFQAAKVGKNGDVVFYSEALDHERDRIMRVQENFENGLRNGEFLVYYQPKVDINTRELIGAEALCRWLKDGKIVPPSEFIPVLERGSDICRLDFYMLDRVCKDILRWQAAGLRTVKVSVNLSRRHMMDPDLLEHIIGIIDRNGVPHEFIEIELTETTTDVEFRDLKRVVNGLQTAGIYTSVDDFGVGYSSLNLIKEIPWNVLKLDRSLLPDKGNMKRGSQMYRHIVSMAKEIGMVCVAEGVETQEQMDILKDYGCNIVQGFYFDKPLPVADFEERLKWHNY